MTLGNIPIVLINLSLTILTIVVGIAITWGRLKEKISSFEEDLQDLKSCLYKENGTNVYVSKIECQDKYKYLFDKFDKIDDKISDIQVSIADLKSKVFIFTEQEKDRR